MFQLVTVNGLNFNDDSDRHYYITDESGLSTPPVRLVSYDLPNQNFGIFVSALYGKRTFTLGGIVIGDSISDFVARRDALYSAFDISAGEIPITFILGNGRIVSINAVCKQLDFSPTAGDVVATGFNAQFEASFPFLLNPTINQFSVSLPQGGGGTIPFPTMPTGLSGSIGGSVIVSNAGNAKYWPKARVYGPVVNPVLTNVALGLSLQINMTVASGQYLDIDFKRKTIIDNFGTNQYSNKAGDWWYLLPGDNPILLSASSYSSSALANIFAQDSWLAL